MGQVFLPPDRRHSWDPSGPALGACMVKSAGLEIWVHMAVLQGFKSSIIPRCLTLSTFEPLKRTKFCTSFVIILDLYSWNTLTLSKKIIKVGIFSKIMLE